eukprot:RCo055189
MECGRPLTFEQFCYLTVPLGEVVLLKKEFHRADGFCKGKLDMADLGDWVSATLGENMTFSELRGMLRTLDSDGDNMVTFWEFFALQLFLKCSQQGLTLPGVAGFFRPAAASGGLGEALAYAHEFHGSLVHGTLSAPSCPLLPGPSVSPVCGGRDPPPTSLALLGPRDPSGISDSESSTGAAPSPLLAREPDLEEDPLPLDTFLRHPFVDFPPADFAAGRGGPAEGLLVGLEGLSPQVAR